MYVTFYAALDNDPAGSTDIAYPLIHSKAGGVGTFANPVIFATDRRELPVGTKIYYPPLKRYFINEDDCAECDVAWAKTRYRWIDLWAGNSTDKRVLACEDKWTSEGQVPAIVNPPSNKPVNTTPIFNPKTKKCL